MAVDGRLEWREWETAEQQKRQAVSIVADVVQFLDAPGERDGELVGAGVRGRRTSSPSRRAPGVARDRAAGASRRGDHAARARQ